MRTIIPAPENSALRAKAKPVPENEMTSERIASLIRDMKELLSKEEYGVALAAPQVGETLRLFIVSGKAIARDARNAPEEEKEGMPNGVEEKKEESEALPDQVYINPELLKLSRGRKDKHEGCLSIRGKWGMVPRAEKATLRAYDEQGRAFTRGASGFLAHVFQHEMDHLDGVLYIDKATEVYDDEPEQKE